MQAETGFSCIIFAPRLNRWFKTKPPSTLTSEYYHTVNYYFFPRFGNRTCSPNFSRFTAKPTANRAWHVCAQSQNSYDRRRARGSAFCGCDSAFHRGELSVEMGFSCILCPFIHQVIYLYADGFIIILFILPSSNRIRTFSQFPKTQPILMPLSPFCTKP